MRAVSAPYEIEGKSVRIGASVGAAIFPRDAQDHKAATLLKAADMALYDAKASGRGAVKFFVEDMALAVRRRRKLGGRPARRARRSGQLTLAYQPIIDIAGGRMLAVEALLRWTHPQFGAVSPLGIHPDRRGDRGRSSKSAPSCWTTPAGTPSPGPTHVRIAVNLSAVQFERGDLEATVRESLERTGLAPERLELEITESILIGNHVAVLESSTGCTRSASTSRWTISAPAIRR